MSHSTVVNLTPYALCLSTGRHLSQGEVAEVEVDETVRLAVADGRLGIVNRPKIEEPKAVPKPEPKPAPKNDTPSQETK